MIKLLAIGLTLCVILTVDMTSAGQGGKEEPAVVAAEDWLKLVDDGKFAESWKEAAEYFKGMVNQESMGTIDSERQSAAGSGNLQKTERQELRHFSSRRSRW